jgi:uncharacterized membrane protein YfcA
VVLGNSTLEVATGKIGLLAGEVFCAESSLPVVVYHLPLPAPPAELVLALILATIGSAVQGVLGFGLAVVAAPTLMLYNSKSVFVPGPMLLAAMLLTLLIALGDRGSVAKDEVAIGAVGRVVGMLPAAYALSVMSQSQYNVLFAGLILFGVLLSASGWHLQPTPKTLFAASILSAFAGTISSVGGPPLALVYQHQKGPHIRGTMSTIFTLGTVISLIGLWWVDRFGRAQVVAGLLLMPAVVAGFAASRYMTHWIDGKWTRPAILAVSVLSAVVIVVKVLH